MNTERDYQRLGENHTREQRLAAARAAIGLTWGIDWVDARAISYVAGACDKLLAFAGDDAYAEAGAEVGLMQLPDDRPVPELWPGALGNIRRAFNVRETPNGRKYWSEVGRHAQRCAQG